MTKKTVAEKAWGEATDNAVSVLMSIALGDEYDDWLSWYNKNKDYFFGPHRAAGVYMEAKLRGKTLK